MLEEQDIAMEKEEKLTGRKHKSIFEVKNEKFRWSRWREKASDTLYKFVRDEDFILWSGDSDFSDPACKIKGIVW